MLELLWLLLTTILAWARPHQDLVLEHLLLRHQLAVLTRPTRTQPRAGLRAWDKRMPEQRNRMLIDHMSDILLPFNRYHRENLERENEKLKAARASA